MSCSNLQKACGSIAALSCALSACAVDATSVESGLTEAAVELAEARRPPCLEKSSQVVLIGDSYIDWVSHTFPADLNRAAGGAKFRNHAVGGFSMATGGIGSIPSEIDDAVQEDPDIIAAVVTGGGNDILVPDLFQFPHGLDCTTRTDSPTIAECQKIVALATEAARGAMRELADAGVRDVVYFFYPHVPEGTLIGGPHPNQILDYAKPMVEAACAEALTDTLGQLACHFVDLIPVFEDHPEYFAPTDIHPNPRGSAAMAQAIWEKMTLECVAQPESSGCCEPQDHVIIE
jgi:hypothetical protein